MPQDAREGRVCGWNRSRHPFIRRIRRFYRLLGIFVAFGVNCFAQHGGGAGASLLLGIVFAIVVLWLLVKVGRIIWGWLVGTKKRSIFVSYRRDDSAHVVGRMTGVLGERLGRDSLFKDVDCIDYGKNFRLEVEKALKTCKVLLAVIGKNWAGIGPDGKTRLDEDDDLVRTEIETALNRGIKVIPVLVMGASIPTKQSLPASLRGLADINAIPIREDPDFSGDMDRLIKGIRRR